MTNLKIRVTKDMPLRRQAGGGVRSWLATLAAWWRRVRGKQSPPAVHVEPVLRVGPDSRNSKGIQGQIREVVRIRRPPQTGHGVTGDDFAASSPRSAIEVSKRKHYDEMLIKVDTNKSLCQACTDELKADDPKARCSANPEHLVHRRCLKLIKYRCPICGANLA
jgi:hypothetical protein